MQTQTIIDLRKASFELHQIVEHNKAQAARADADNICRLSDGAVAQCEATAKAIDALTERFVVMIPLAQGETK